MAAATAAALLAGGASSGSAPSGGGESTGAAPLQRQQRGGGEVDRSGHLGEGEREARAEQKKVLAKIMALPAGPRRRVFEHAHALACRDAEAFRDIDEAIMLHAAKAELDDVEAEEAKQESEFEREEQVRFEMDVEREIEVEEADLAILEGFIY